MTRVTHCHPIRGQKGVFSPQGVFAKAGALRQTKGVVMGGLLSHTKDLPPLHQPI